MITQEKLAAVRTVITHDNCSDGLVSALLVKDVLPQANIRFVQYGTDEFKSLRPEAGMMFTDFSPPEHLADAFKEAGTLILDHHKTAKGIVESFGDNGVFGDEVLDPGVCGAVLVHKHVWLPLQSAVEDRHRIILSNPPAPSRTDVILKRAFVDRLCRLAGIRDTWVKDSPEWDEACQQTAVIGFVPKEKWLEMGLDTLCQEWSHKYSWIGKLIQERNAQSTEKATRGAWYKKTSKDTKLCVFEGTRATSDVAELLGSSADIVIGVSQHVDNGKLRMVFSLRSHNGFDVSALGRFHGGGGHTKAAGCSRTYDFESCPNSYAAALELVEQYEAR